MKRNDLPEFVLTVNDWILPRETFDRLHTRYAARHINFIHTNRGWFDLREANGVTFGFHVTDKRLCSLLDLQQIQRRVLASKVARS